MDAGMQQQTYVAPAVTAAAVPAQAAAPAAVMPAGWYADPVAGVGERWWDGVAWSQDFTRPGPQAVVPGATPADPFKQPHAVNRVGIKKGIVPMVIGAAGLIFRTIALASVWDPPADPVAAGYTSGTRFGVGVGLLISASIFTWGLERFRSAAEALDGEPRQVDRSETLKFSLIIVAVCVAIAFVIH